MKKFFGTLVPLLLFGGVNTQMPECRNFSGNRQIPGVEGVAACGEVPVSLYTGMPPIGIPGHSHAAAGHTCCYAAEL